MRADRDGTEVATIDDYGATGTITINPVADQITTDGRNYLNLATNISKLSVSYTPIDLLSIQTNVRVFWGVRGRSAMSKADQDLGFDYLGISDEPMVKWNLGVQLNLPEEFVLSLYAYDLLGTSTNRHAVRWQQMAYSLQREIFTVDQRSFQASLSKEF